MRRDPFASRRVATVPRVGNVWTSALKVLSTFQWIPFGNVPAGRIGEQELQRR